MVFDPYQWAALQGWVPKRLKGPPWKGGRGASPAWVRIPLHPLACWYTLWMARNLTGSWRPITRQCISRKWGEKKPKVVHFSQPEARSVAEKMTAKRGVDYSSYWCARHQGWHVGRNPQRLKPLSMFVVETEIELGERVCAHLYSPQTVTSINNLFNTTTRRRGPMATTLLS